MSAKDRSPEGRGNQRKRDELEERGVPGEMAERGTSERKTGKRKMDERGEQIAALLLVHQARPSLPRLLSQLQQLDELIILDQQSGIDWQAFSLPARTTILSSDKKLTDFAATRNRLAQKAEADWLFWIDSDELLTDQQGKILCAAALKEELRVSVEKLKKGGRHVLLLPRQDYFFGKPLSFGEVGLSWKGRLYKKGWAQFERAVHEELVLRKECVGTEYLASQSSRRSRSLRLQHQAHESVSSFLSRIGAYAALDATLQAEKSVPRLIFELLTFPPLKFCWLFVFRLGFLDGHRGLIYASLMSLHSFSSRVMAYEIKIR